MKLTNSVLLLIAILVLASFTQADSPGKALKIHNAILTIDTHLDTPLNLLREGFNLAEIHDASDSKLDIPKMEKGGLDAAFFAVFTSQKPRTDENTEATYALAHRIIDSVYSMAAQNADKVELGTNPEDLLTISQKGKKGIYLGMENGFPLGKEIKRVEEFYNRGVRYITLSHSSNNDICDSSTDEDGPEHGGLSSFGEEVVHEMNRLGMIIDVSHVSDESFFDVMALSEAPVIASHSSVRTICGHPRNMSDTMIKVLAEKEGVIQICLLGAYIENEDTTSQNYLKMQELKVKYNGFKFADDAERDQAWKEWGEINKTYPPKLPSIKKAVDHIDYVVNLVGIDYVGIGSDFDGGGELADCPDVSYFPLITEELVNRGYSKNDIAKIWGGNFMRVFNRVQYLAQVSED